jgi:hypothetical protein
VGPSDECYTYCSIEYNLVAPFFLQLEKTSPNTANCYCCPICVLIYDPSYTVFQVNTPATRNPTQA